MIRAELSGDDEKRVTFNDFVQALAIREIRNQYKYVSLQKLRSAVDFAAKDYGMNSVCETTQDAGRTAADNRLFVNAVLFVLKTGIP